MTINRATPTLYPEKVVEELRERVRKLEANQRTPGTVEVCKACGKKDRPNGWTGEPDALDEKNWNLCYGFPALRCPIRQQKDKPA